MLSASKLVMHCGDAGLMVMKIVWPGASIPGPQDTALVEVV